MPLDPELPQRAAEPVPIPWPSVWQAAFDVLRRLGRNPGDPLFGAVYVEGRAVLADGFIFDHGWLEMGDSIIDPTMWHEEPAYFPGPRWTLVQAEAEAGDDWPLVHRQGWLGIDNAAYRESDHQAKLYAQRVREQKV